MCLSRTTTSYNSRQIERIPLQILRSTAYIFCVGARLKIARSTTCFQPCRSSMVSMPGWCQAAAATRCVSRTIHGRRFVLRVVRINMLCPSLSSAATRRALPFFPTSTRLGNFTTANTELTDLTTTTTGVRPPFGRGRGQKGQASRAGGKGRAVGAHVSQERLPAGQGELPDGQNCHSIEARVCGSRDGVVVVGGRLHVEVRDLRTSLTSVAFFLGGIMNVVWASFFLGDTGTGSGGGRGRSDFPIWRCRHQSHGILPDRTRNTRQAPSRFPNPQR